MFHVERSYCTALPAEASAHSRRRRAEKSTFQTTGLGKLSVRPVLRDSHKIGHFIRQDATELKSQEARSLIEAAYQQDAVGKPLRATKV
jgi:hypothetical protein